MGTLAFDPGETTGVAAFDEAGNLLFGMTVTMLGLHDKLFQKLTALVSPDVVLVESPPTLARQEDAAGSYYLVTHWFETAGYPVEKINPGQWKGMVKRSGIPGTHQNDAASMARWYFRSRLVNVLK